MRMRNRPGWAQPAASKGISVRRASGASLIRPGTDRAAPHAPVEELLTVLAGLVIVQVLPLDVWRSGVAGLLVVLGLVLLNSGRLPAGAFCWPNIFLGVLALFHLSYYVLAINGLIAALPFMPDLRYSSDTTVALQLFVTASLALEAGVFAYLTFVPRGSRRHIDHGEKQRHAFFTFGICITVLALALFAVYVQQLGGLSAFVSVDYTTYVTFLQSSDPRFASLSIEYIPAGLLVMYMFLDRSQATHRKRGRWLLVVFLLFTLWLLWIGDRSAALLYWLALAYLYHIHIRPISLRTAATVVVGLILVVAPIKAIRNVTPAQRSQALASSNLNPLNGLSEMGLTFRPYLALVQQRTDGTALGFQPYSVALSHALPNFGAFAGRGPAFRTTLYASKLVDPVSTALGIGSGGSAIGEAFIAFGIPGVLITFSLIGWLIALLETRAVAGSAPALALIPLIFHSLDFFARDDVYGLSRALIWAAAGVFAVRFFTASPRTGRGTSLQDGVTGAAGRA
jgi:oligosaccharide repeat unit polymerase